MAFPKVSTQTLARMTCGGSLGVMWRIFTTGYKDKSFEVGSLPFMHAFQEHAGPRDVFTPNLLAFLAGVPCNVSTVRTIPHAQRYPGHASTGSDFQSEAKKFRCRRHFGSSSTH